MKKLWAELLLFCRLNYRVLLLLSVSFVLGFFSGRVSVKPRVIETVKIVEKVIEKKIADTTIKQSEQKSSIIIKTVHRKRYKTVHKKPVLYSETVTTISKKDNVSNKTNVQQKVTTVTEKSKNISVTTTTVTLPRYGIGVLHPFNTSTNVLDLTVQGQIKLLSSMNLIAQTDLRLRLPQVGLLLLL